MYDYIIVGAGLTGAIFAYEAKKRNKKVLVIEKRNHIGGNLCTETIEGIDVHMYGAHIFHTSNDRVWQYMNQFVKFNHYVNSPIARYKDQVYNLPFNMNTFSKLFGVITPEEAINKIEQEKKETNITIPKNLEEQALMSVGKTVYEVLIKGYTEKQWGKPCIELPTFIIKRLPLRFTYDNNYFNDPYQGIPINGYTPLFEKLLDGIEIQLETDFLENKSYYLTKTNKVLFTGPIDQYYDYQFGHLEYRSLDFQTQILDTPNFQGNAVVNYTEASIPHTRIIEHKHFSFGNQPKTVITYEYPKTFTKDEEPYYPINDSNNQELYERYQSLSRLDNKVIFAGRLGLYKYLNMDQIVLETLNLVDSEFK
ncbi:MAG: UDP-galactopyranose mutase [Bacteroidales bacterium]